MRGHYFRPWILALCVGYVGAGEALAQTPPPTVDAARIPTPPVLPPARDGEIGKPRLQMPQDGVPSEQAGKVKFHLTSVTLEGNQVFSSESFRDLYANQLGKEVSLAEIYELGQQITQKYRDAGYLLARAIVPPQDVTDGKLKLQILEGDLSRFDIQTDSDDVRNAITPLAEKLIAEKPITSATIERYLLLMNDLPGLKVRSVLAPSPDKPGSAAITLIAERSRIQASAGIDTYGNSYIGPERLSANVIVNGLVDAKDALNVSTLFAPDHEELAYGALGYSRALDAEGTTLGLTASEVKTKPSLPLSLGGALKPEGEATNLGISVMHPFIRSRLVNWSTDGGLDFSRNKTTYAPGLSAIETTDDQRVLNLNNVVSLSDELRGYNRLQLGLRKGLDIAGASQEGEANLSRARGNPEFFKVTGEVSRLQGLWGPFSLLTSAQGQWANDPLLSSEQYGVGGQLYGRGFDASEITGDEGAAGKVELIWQPETTGINRWFSQSLHASSTDILSAMQIYAFYDGGVIWNIDPVVGQDKRQSLTSTGVGSRFTLMDRLSGDIFFAMPLTNEVASRADDKRDDWRMQFSLRATIW